MDSEELSRAGEAPPSADSGPGATLRAARLGQRLELSHIAAETRIPLRHLEAIEEDNFESLPSRAYAIGFTRTYAKVLGLNDVQIVDAVRAELADGSMRRTMPAGGMEPGDPARLPSKGLAWAAAGAVLILAVGVFAFARSYFGAGAELDSLLVPEPAATIAAAKPAAPAPASGGPVVLTALEDGIWVRLYEEGGERLTERTLKLGETLEVPVAAKDPRINTGRPDALSVTIGGQGAPKLSDKAETVSGLPVSAAALAARGTATPAVTPTPVAVVAGTGPAQRPARRNLSAPAPSASAAAAAGEGSAPASAPAAEPAAQPAPAGR